MASLPLQPCDGCPPLASPRPAWHRPASPQRAVDLLDEAARHVLYTLRLWRQRIRARTDLARLDDRLLRDIGLTPADRDFLVNKPFWRE